MTDSADVQGVADLLREALEGLAEVVSVREETREIELRMKYPDYSAQSERALNQVEALLLSRRIHKMPLTNTRPGYWKLQLR